jgi:hypothetical protein
MRRSRAVTPRSRRAYPPAVLRPVCIAIVLMACGSEPPTPPTDVPMDNPCATAGPPCGCRTGPTVTQGVLACVGGSLVCECVAPDTGVPDVGPPDVVAPMDSGVAEDRITSVDVAVDVPPSGDREQNDAGPCARCAFPNARTNCSDAGVCSLVGCLDGFGDCDGRNENGCERSLNEAASCGTCGNSCPSGVACVDGRCDTCASMYRWCSTASRCVDTQTDPMNCGRCGVACMGKIRGCINGACCFMINGRCCTPGFANCDGNLTNSCETSILNDPRNCGGCFDRCPADQRCVMGVCTP